jgi:hypothetical protein
MAGEDDTMPEEKDHRASSPQGDGDRGEKGTPTEETEGQEEGEPSGE